MSRLHPGPSAPLRAAARLGLALLLIAGFGLVASAAPAAAKPKAPKLSALRCVPPTAPACAKTIQVTVGGQLALRGQRLARGQRVTFRWSDGHKTGKLARKAKAWVVTVPKGVPTGTVTVSVKDRAGRKSNRKRLKVVAASVAPVDGPAAGTSKLPDAFKGAGIWIHDLATADGGTAAAIVARVRAAGLDTVYLKSAEGDASYASQFSPALVGELKAAGVRVCGWQYLYGNNPEGEAAQVLDAIRAGAQCYVVNAEKELIGRYAEAQRYLRAVRAGAGADFPLGFTSFGVPTTQPGFPYSVFLGPGGAQTNFAQVYWDEVDNTTVSKLSADVLRGNRIYGRPISPIGQTYDGVTFDDAQQFRAIWKQYGAAGLSWFVWGATKPEIWNALQTEPPILDAVDAPDPQFFQLGSTGDGVLWMQQHLAAFDRAVALDGVFGAGTEAALRRFQVARGLNSTGGTGPQTWAALLKEQPVAIDWVARGNPK